MKYLHLLLNKIDRNNKKTVAIAQAADESVLLAVKHGLTLEIANFRLYGNKSDMEEIAKSVSLDLYQKEITIINIESEQLAVREAIKSINNGTAHVLMKGNLPTKSLLKSVLDKQLGLRLGTILSQVAIFEVPNQEKLLLLTDAAMNISPSLNDKIEILKNAVDVAARVGIKNPKVAAMTAIETVNPSMQATLDAASLKESYMRGEIKNCIFDGPMAFDVAVSRKASEQKKIDSEVAGQADILLVPTIEVGNALYKSFIYFANAKVASIICGAKVPIVLPSRSDTAENKLLSIALAIISSEEEQNGNF
ncbi:bifunctional enoyl-CoA hydratase/phosphate acetyltransferase [Aquibacillus rhizosphaerae]|uniref:Bifunctional enoyl-CoA hydratase/phosphate acetyltransferase n=1 Tax=Aquibacillus rhizosphaerae TaxID=3051431 RepID=A0ABT7L8B3_9BACI|nr:bifunctional enoyl-CoA hydratase/phosphate acetyltransferase [Aquibacillus sp. LR5S19]MDL4841609.1 bifunctional enoyl-CoA hydratase/phosphate acetyltransferase [Aquibacillus sp. LR5S19]